MKGIPTMMERAQRLISTRGGTLILAGLAALIAGVAVFAYVHSYRKSVKQGAAPATVLVAKSLIAKGTPGELVASARLFRVRTIRESQLRQGAVADAAALRGRIATTDISPGMQLSTADFALGTGTLASGLHGSQRAMTISIDSAHGMIGQIRAGDRVDVYAGFNLTPPGSAQSRPVLRLLMQDIPVLVAAKSSSQLSGGASTSNVTLQATAAQTAKLAFTADNGKLWLVLRPPTGGKASPPSLVTVETLMLGVPPVEALRSLGGTR
jgi:Flp pilus assembly protein CpaB